MKKKRELAESINRQAGFNYALEKNFVAGIKLSGSEVKSVKEGLVSFVDSYCIFNAGELFLKSLHITPLKHTQGHVATADRKLLLTKNELKKLEAELKTGYTIVPLRVFENEKGLIKVEISLAKGKKQYDKRDSIKNKDIDRQTQRDMSY
jgi:SsrA-binding protein